MSLEGITKKCAICKRTIKYYDIGAFSDLENGIILCNECYEKLSDREYVFKREK